MGEATRFDGAPGRKVGKIPIDRGEQGIFLCRRLAEIVEPFQQIDPTGKSPETPSSPSDKNILIFRSGKSVYIARIPSQQEGAFRERHGRRGGDAVDATARETGEADADGEIVWS